ncbi:LysR family transcriptional regulator substrate-binding protein [Parablautia muri]|uniref:LysR family transcriptional regulator substrate-binding protein n=1 Tax=Parablautia muri TaxID=2320879 RepID=UPI002ED068EE
MNWASSCLSGETDGIRLLAKVARKVQCQYPQVHFHIVSGDRVTVAEDMDKGLIDFGLLFGEIDVSKYEYMRIPYKDSFGVLMRRDSPLAGKKIIKPEDLLDKPLILSRQMIYDSDLTALFHCSVDKLNIAATYNLLFNGSLMVDEGMGYAICLDKIINVSGESSLCFRPLEPRTEASMNLVWKKYQVFTKASHKFLLMCREVLEQ